MAKDYEALDAKPGRKSSSADDEDSAPAGPSCLRPLTPEEQDAVAWWLHQVHPTWFPDPDAKALKKRGSETDSTAQEG